MSKLDEIQDATKHLLWCLEHADQIAIATPSMSLAEHIIFNSEKILTLSGEL